MNYVMDNLPTIVTIMGGLVLIVLYAKSGDAGSINQGGVGRVVGGVCTATVRSVN